MKKILYVILEKWADWELAYISSAVNMLGGGNFENKTVSLTKDFVTSIGGVKCLPDYDLQSVPSNFVEPSYQHKGIGRKIIVHLENDEYAKRAKRIEIHSAISAIPFYRKLGYEHKNGDLSYKDGMFDLEKFI